MMRIGEGRVNRLIGRMAFVEYVKMETWRLFVLRRQSLVENETMKISNSRVFTEEPEFHLLGEELIISGAAGFFGAKLRTGVRTFVIGRGVCL
jgi:hypothetical protein